MNTKAIKEADSSRQPLNEHKTLGDVCSEILEAINSLIIALAGPEERQLQPVPVYVQSRKDPRE
jgi:hypothetical protein